MRCCQRQSSSTFSSACNRPSTALTHFTIVLLFLLSAYPAYISVTANKACASVDAEYRLDCEIGDLLIDGKDQCKILQLKFPGIHAKKSVKNSNSVLRLRFFRQVCFGVA